MKERVKTGGENEEGEGGGKEGGTRRRKKNHNKLYGIMQKVYTP